MHTIPVNRPRLEDIHISVILVQQIGKQINFFEESIHVLFGFEPLYFFLTVLLDSQAKCIFHGIFIKRGIQ